MATTGNRSKKNAITSPSILSRLLYILPTLASHHAPNDELHQLLKTVARDQTEHLFKSRRAVAQPFGPFGEITLPFHRMGAVTSINLFDLDELIMFSFYWHN